MRINPFLPLHIVSNGPAPIYRLCDNIGNPLLSTYASDPRGQERAEYAAQAINSHAELVSLLTRAAEDLNDYARERHSVSPLAAEIAVKLATL